MVVRLAWLGLSLAVLLGIGGLQHQEAVTAAPDAGQNTVAVVIDEAFGHAIITASSASDGSALSGYVTTRAADGTLAEGAVYCLLVHGTGATVGVQFTGGSPQAMGGYVLYFLQDNGHGQPAPDALGISPLTAEPQACVSGSADLPIAHSMVSIRQAGP